MKHCALALYQPLSQHYIHVEWRTHLIKPIFNLAIEIQSRNIDLVLHLKCQKGLFTLIEFMNSTISTKEFGFLHNHFTLQQLLIFLNTVNLRLMQFTWILRKAFDSVAHNELLFKLQSFGMNANLWNWFQAYLTNRVQCVSVNNTVSDVLPVVSGVLQGSILGSIMFLLFVN